MKSVGQILKRKRQALGLSLEEVQKEIKISPENLKALEEDNFAKLPSSAFVKGFIQNYSQFLGLNSSKLIAIFRRDWGKKEPLNIIPFMLKNSMVKPASIWTPKTTAFIGAILILGIFLTYFLVVIKKYFSPPHLIVKSPLPNIEISKKSLMVSGKTDPDASIYINNELITKNLKGEFNYELRLDPGENVIKVKAVDRRSKITEIERRVTALDKKEEI